MGRTKRKSFENDMNQISDIFKAIGHPARLQVLTILLEKKHCTCGEIVSLLPISQSTVSKHLIELKKVNLIGELFDGKKTIFYLKKDSLVDTNDFLTNFINSCKYGNVFNAHKNIPTKKKKTDLKFEENMKPNLKNKIRKANPDLKNHNYTFNHLSEKKSK